MEIEFKDVMDRVGKKLGQLQIDNDILTLQLERLQREVDELRPREGVSDVVDAEIVKDGDTNGR